MKTVSHGLKDLTPEGQKKAVEHIALLLISEAEEGGVVKTSSQIQSEALRQANAIVWRIVLLTDVCM